MQPLNVHKRGTTFKAVAIEAVRNVTLGEKENHLWSREEEGNCGRR